MNLSKLQSEAVKKFEKQEFCFTDYEGIRKLRTNEDLTDKVKQFLSDQIQKAYEEGYEEARKNHDITYFQPK